MGRDTRTRYQGVYARHRKGCKVEDGRPCNCRPSFYGKVWDRAARRHLSTARFPTATAARGARSDLLDALDRGERPGRSDVRLRHAVDSFITAARGGVALNKHGRRYKPSAVDDLESVLRVHVLPRYGNRRLTDLRRAECQRLVDELAAGGMSGSRVRSVVNAVRSLYRYAQDRELAAADPAQHVRLPAMDATPRERVATPGELRGLLDALPLPDALPYALAGYGSARRGELLRLPWSDVDLDLGAVRLGGDETGRKYDASLRVVPLVAPLATMLRRAYMAQGRPTRGLVCPPRHHAKTGLLSPTGLAGRARERWEAAKLAPIGLHECRHTFATWLDHAGVSPKVASVLMGHSTPGRQADAAAITLARYTHTLPGELERARDLLDGFIAEREQEAQAR